MRVPRSFFFVFFDPFFGYATTKLNVVFMA